MSLPRTVAEVIDQHVTLELESLDRVYLNVYQPELQTPRAVFQFLRDHHGQGAVSSHQMKAISERFLQSIDRFADDHVIPIIGFEKGQRKEDVAAEYLAKVSAPERVLFIGKAQERVRTFRTEGRRNQRGETYPWIVESTAMVNQYDFMTSTPSTPTSGRSSSSTARTSLRAPSCVSTAMNISNTNSPRCESSTHRRAQSV
jgi:hypothetical protein